MLMRHKPFWLVLIILTLAAFAFLGMHHHDHGQDANHCQICQSIRALASLIPAFFGIWFFVISPGKRFVPQIFELTSLFHPSSNRNRAPPLAA